MIQNPIYAEETKLKMYFYFFEYAQWNKKLLSPTHRSDPHYGIYFAR